MTGSFLAFSSRFPAKRRAFRKKSSFALVIVLLMVVLLSAIIVAFLSFAETNRGLSSLNSSSANAEILSQAALDSIVGDLLDEITFNSTNALANSGTNIYYLPTTNIAIVPQRTGINPDLFPYSVVKISHGGVPFWYDPVTPNGTNIGPIGALPNSAFSSATDQYSVNNLRVAPNRWLLPGFMGTALPADFTVPDWVLVTRSGPVDTRVATPQIADLSNPTSTNFAVGRFSYVVYDVGGLVDITVAGSGLDQTTSGNRFRASQIPLNVIPGIDTVANASNIVYWRDNSYMGNSSYLLSATNTFTNVQPTEQTFVNRQDLIRFQEDNPSWISPGALQYLTVFSRSLNRPLFTAPTSVTVPGNVASPTVKYSNTNTYSNPAELFDVRQSNGDLVMKNRFPLSRLGLFTNATANATAIQNYFGLTRNPSDNYSWIYRGNTNSTAIATLAQVATNNPPREPDFFEVLQAAILSGSLGQGGTTNLIASNFSEGESLVETRYRDNDVTRHVLQIGANLIDQYDPDDFPTIIKHTVQGKMTLAGAMVPLVGDVRGIENIPYLEDLTTRFYRPTTIGGDINQDPNRTYIGAWFHPQFWNPHQNAFSSGSGASGTTPKQFRIVMTEGKLYVQYKYYGNGSGSSFTSNTVPVDYYTAYQSDASTPTPYQVQFTNGPSAFVDPQSLMPGQYGTLSPTNTTYYAGSLGLTAASESYPREGGSAKGQTGILAGYEYVPANPYPATTTNVLWQAVLTPQGDTQQSEIPTGRFPTFECQFKDSGGTWRTYQRFADLGRGTDSVGTSAIIFETVSGGVPVDNGRDVLYTKWTRTGMYSFESLSRVDPRGERLGLAADQTNNVSEPVQTGHDAFSPGPPINSLLFYADPNATDIQVAEYPFAQNAWESTPTVLNDFMADRDGAVRPGDANPPKGVDPLVRYSNTSPSAMDTPDGSPTPTADSTVLRKRPLILNRPFQSVGEMGYASRDLPWKTLDFCSTNSPDGALLDYFTCEDPYGPDPAANGWGTDQAVTNTALLRGKVSLNTQQPVALEALINGATLDVYGTNSAVLPSGSPYLTSTATIGTLATNLANYTQVTATSSTAVQPSLNGLPLKTRSGLINALAANSAMTNIAPPGTGSGYIKTEQEAVVRALSDLGDTQTWNLMIDVIAQSGHYVRNAATPAATNFIVTGERRYWLHVAIDRYTGKVVDSHLEAVDE